MKRICEFCKKEYNWEEGQLNWKKDGTLGTNPGSISSKRFCCYACGKIYQSDLQKQTRIKKSIENPDYYKEMIEKVRLTSLQKYNNPTFNNVEKNKRTKKANYGNENYNNRKKVKQTCLQKYGTDNVFKVPEIKEKYKKTCLQKYGVTWFLKSDLHKSLYKNPEWEQNRQKTRNLTLKKHNSFNKSKQEDQIYDLLLQKYIKVERQYKSEIYPFSCDFYIPELNLYIEYQGTWEHGNKPYDKNDLECIDLLNKWNIKNKIRYKNAIKIYTISDPLKRQIAKENNLNWIEFFNMKEFEEWYNGI